MKKSTLLGLLTFLLTLSVTDAWALAKIIKAPMQNNLQREDDPSKKDKPKFYVMLEGSECQISADSEGRTIVFADGEDITDWTDENGITIDWKKTIIYAGGEEDMDIGTCNITMTGGEVYGIYGAGYYKDATGTVNVSISGGRIRNIRAAGPYDNYVLHGTFNLIMTGGEYISWQYPYLVGTDETKVYVIVTGVKYTYDDVFIDADPSHVAPEEEEEDDPYTWTAPDEDEEEIIDSYCRATGCLAQNAAGTEYFMSGTLTNTIDLTIPRLTICEGAVLTNRGNIKVTRCNGLTNIGTVTGNEIDSHNHNYAEVKRTEPTCSENGLCVYSCTYCSAFKLKKLFATGNHNEVVVPGVEATCTTSGYGASSYCQDCGKFLTFGLVVKAKGHAYLTNFKTGEPSKYTDYCTNSSHTLTYKECIRCGARDYDPAESRIYAHSYTLQDDYSVAPTCTTDGKKKYSCSKCKNSYEISIDGSRLGHQPIYHEAHEATCTTSGRPAYYSCERTGCKQLSMDGNNWNNFKIMTIPALGHDYSAQSATAEALASPATCTEKATYYYSCAQCNAVNASAEAATFEAGSVLGHHFSIKDIDYDPEFPEAGSVTLHCDQCDADFSNFTFNRNTIQKRTTHNRSDNTAKSTLNYINSYPTCSRPGEALYTLTMEVSGQKLQKDFVAELAKIENRHLWNTDGTCALCGAHYAATLRWPLTYWAGDTQYYTPGQAFVYDSVEEAIADCEKCQDDYTDYKELAIFQDATLQHDIRVANGDAIYLNVDLNNHTVDGQKDIIMGDGAHLCILNGTLNANIVEGSEGIVYLAMENAKVTFNKYGISTGITKLGGSEFNFMLEDGQEYRCDRELPVDNAWYSRQFDSPGQWEALFVPVPVSCEDSRYDVAEIYAVGVLEDTNGNGSLDADDEKVLIVRNLTSGCTEPGTPYLIRSRKAGRLTIDSADGTLCEPSFNELTCGTTRNSYTFNGTYENMDIAPSQNLYFMQQRGMLATAEEDTTLQPLRWYMTSESKTGGYNSGDRLPSKVRVIAIGEEIDEETAIRMVDASSSNHSSEPVYNLSGIRMNGSKLPAGLYIQGGRKVVR